VFINQEVKSLELLERISALKTLQSQGEMRALQIKMDTKDFGIGAQILHDLDITKIKLLSNSSAPTKRVGMIGYGLEITEYIAYQ
jgi:3,4-dihydroxy 2-butanone 4-phosphate synthase/GTP cyclohydrolase II